MSNANNVDIFKLKLNDGKLSVQPEQDASMAAGNYDELLQAIRSLVGGDFDRILASNKKFIDPTKDMYFEISLDNTTLKLVERSSVKRQEYEINLETQTILFNRTEVPPSFIDDIARRLRKYAETLKSDPKVSLVRVKQQGDRVI
jgi:hypothetical protein